MQWNRGGGGGGGPGGAGQALLGERARPQRSSIEIVKRVGGVFWPYRVAVLALLVTVTASALIGLAPPLLFASIIDNVNKMTLAELRGPNFPPKDERGSVLGPIGE